MAKRSGGPTFIQRSRNKSPVEKATFHQITGAGKSHVKRPFLGLTDADEEHIRKRLVEGMKRNIDNAGRG